MYYKKDDPSPRCRLSDPANPHTLRVRRNNPRIIEMLECFTCGPEGHAFEIYDWHYYCDICELVFHERCRVRPPGMRHPYHFHHPLAITIRFSETFTQTFNTNATEFVRLVSNIPEPDNLTTVFVSNNACDWCGKELGEMFFRCLVCNFSLDRSCLDEDPPFNIPNPKSHQHPLTLFPRPLLVACNACGLGGIEEPGYACLQCNYFVHKSCIDLPRVIKLTRHPHRLSYTPCLPPPIKRSCGVCHKSIDVKYGLYSCNKDCSYAVHSKCATHRDIWDGKELEGMPEEDSQDTPPFEEVGYNLINHFSHKHHLRFKGDGLDHDANKQCQACCRPVDSDGFYSCISHCDFFLHASCANLPRKIDHPLHKHPLFLKPKFNYRMSCAACGRDYNGFSYECSSSYCDYRGAYFRMDVGCALVGEPFEHKVHSHPLVIFSHKDSSSLCGFCCKKCQHHTLRCNHCEFIMCFKCATIPTVVRYKHDEHPLILCSGEDSSGSYWCEVCEKGIDPKKRFYTCNKCCTTLHVKCVFGPFMHLKNGRDFDITEYEFKIASNNGNTRAICDECGARCLYTGIFKGKDICICSFKCMSKLPDSPIDHTKFKFRFTLGEKL